MIGKEQSMSGFSTFGLFEVEQKDAYCVNALNKEIAYLTSFDADRLLAGFRETAGLDTKGAKRYGGWENMLIGGHTMGHYLSAMAQAYANCGVSDADRKEIYKTVSYIIDELLICQENSKGKKGFIFGATMVDENGKRCAGTIDAINVEAQFDRVEKGRTNIITESWVPWYTMHKLFAGLIAVCELMGGYAGTGTNAGSNADTNTSVEKKADSNSDPNRVAEKALTLLRGLGDWTCNRAFGWSEETRRTVVSIEYGGMNDVLYELYALTGEDRYCLAGDKFDEPVLYDKVASGEKDVLNNHHANTTIPKFIGALNRYIAVHGRTVDGKLRDETRYLDYAGAFWDMVVERHTYITGGNSEWEHFGVDRILNGERTACNNQTCNVYNMLKLSKGLFMVTGQKKYLDYYENTFINSILSSQNPESGMTTYFQPMATGYFKTYGEPFTKFWCCTGSGMENFTKLNDSLFFYDENGIFVNMYFSSVLKAEKFGLKLTVDADLLHYDSVKIRLSGLGKDGMSGDLIPSMSGNSLTPADFRLYLRIPGWAEGMKVYYVNNKEYTIADGAEFIEISGPFADTDQIGFELPKKLKVIGLPDDDKVFGLKYGPFVLSADLGRENMSTTITGVDVTVPARKLVGKDIIVLPEGVTRDEFTAHPDRFLSLCGDTSGNAAQTPQFAMAGSDLVFSPHFLRYRDRYGIYFSYLTKDEAGQAEAEGKLGSGEVVDTVMPGYGQYENDELHAMKESNTESVTSGATYRIAKAGGAFSYRMAVEKGKKNRISMMLRLCDNRKPLKITADGEVLYDGTLAYRGTDQYYPFELDLPESVVTKAEHVRANGEDYDIVRIAFSGTAEHDSAAVCDYVRTVVF
ncbi:MAG: glycoside hydrolase family 127 protein [Lachnospiraceae bacterium]|nr:glycoside hydrolase family 127 protein [Lachnospiraceae bacterium]